MNCIGTNGRWKKTGKGWRYICNDNNRKVNNRSFEPLVSVKPSNITYVHPTTPAVWECVIAYITSPTDLQNLAATCRSLYKLVESELGWTYLIRTKFGYRLWLRHVRQTFYQQNNQKINPHVDLWTAEKIEIDRECATIPATFLRNTMGGELMPIIRPILRSYRYYLETQVSNHIVYMASSEYAFRQFVSFTNIHSECLSVARRRTVILTKLIYFYLADRRHVSVVDFSIIYPHGSVTQIIDPKASTGHALKLNTYSSVLVLHTYKSIMPGRYEVFWRLRFNRPLIPYDNLEFIAVPEYALMAREYIASKQFGNYLDKYKTSYFCRSMGIITVFKRCTVFVGCLDLTRPHWGQNMILDYVEMIAVE